jgi:predicted DNA-binding protein YlxM (UPF0122 family)
MTTTNSPADIADEVEVAATSYEQALRRRGLSEADIEEELQLYRHYVTAAFERAVAELNEWVGAGRVLQ